MAPRKLSDADKQAAVELYKQPGETTSTVAAHFDVSNSTISRLLKMLLSESEYADLRSQKRSGNTDKPPRKAKQTAASKSAESTETEPPKSGRRSRRRSSAPAADQLSLMDDTEAVSSTPSALVEDSSALVEEEPVEADNASEALAGNDFDEDDDDLDEDDLIDEDDLDDLDDLDEDEDEDEDEDDEETPLAAAIQIMPLTETALPMTCYLVIDRLSELITRPLKEFAELAEIPSEEQSARTLPVFDNHRVARRFSRRNQRVIKVPNGQLLTKTRPYLQAKGINHLLIDGTLYSLTGE